MFEHRENIAEHTVMQLTRSFRRRRGCCRGWFVEVAVPRTMLHPMMILSSGLTVPVTVTVRIIAPSVTGVVV